MSRDSLVWRPRTELLKFKSLEDYKAGRYYEKLESTGNVVTTLGVEALWKLLTASSGAPDPFNLSNATVGVGNGTAQATTADTKLSGSNAFLKKVDDPDGITITNADPVTVTFKSTFDVNEAAFTWNEWGIFNGQVNGESLMLNHKIESNGTKTASDIWIFSVTLGLQQSTDDTEV